MGSKKNVQFPVGAFKWNVDATGSSNLVYTPSKSNTQIVYNELCTIPANSQTVEGRQNI